MKKLIVVWLLLLFSGGILAAEPVEQVWKSKSGHEIKATALKVQNGKVFLKRNNGKVIQVALEKFVTEDRDKLVKLFDLSASPTRGIGSGMPRAEGLPHPLGEVTGPIKVTENASYLIYLPNSLKEGRKAPLLFYTHSGGGNASHLNKLTEVADVLGWILAISMESKNKAGWVSNVQSCEDSLSHIVANLPVDKKRIHYTGDSGGGAMAFMNSQTMKAYGVMPNVAYIPSHCSEETTVVYGMGGGYDYNRDYTAFASKKYRKNGFHRMSTKGHGNGPAEHYNDGMFWMHCKYLGKNKSSHRDEMKDFELSALEWLEKVKDSKPHRAYSNAIFLKEIVGLSGENAAVLDLLISNLAKDQGSVSYHKGLLELNELSKKYFAKLGATVGVKQNDTNPKAAKFAKSLKEIYEGTPEIPHILDAVMKPTR